MSAPHNPGQAATDNHAAPVAAPRDRDGVFRKKGTKFLYFKAPDGRGGYRDVSTKEVRHDKALQARARHFEKLRTGTLPDERAKWRVRAAIENEIAFREQTTQSETSTAPTRTTGKNLIRVIEKLLGEKVRLERAVSMNLIERYQAFRRQEGTSPKTVNNEISLFKQIALKAGLWEALADKYKPLTVKKKGPGLALMAEDGMRLFALARTKAAWFVAYCAGLLAYSTGARHREICTLRLRDIHLAGTDPKIHIRRDVAKNDGSDRYVALNEHAVWAARELLERAALLNSCEPDHYLLPANLSKHTKSTDPLRGKTGFDPTRHQTSWSTAWESLRGAAGLPGLRFHDLRHTFITHSIEGGTPVELVMAQVGHLSAVMTRYYTHLSHRSAQIAAQNAARQNAGLVDVIGSAGPPPTRTERQNA